MKLPVFICSIDCCLLRKIGKYILYVDLEYVCIYLNCLERDLSPVLNMTMDEMQTLDFAFLSCSDRLSYIKKELMTTALTLVMGSNKTKRFHKRLCSVNRFTPSLHLTCIQGVVNSGQLLELLRF